MVLFGIFFTIDKARAERNDPPLFSVRIAQAKDGGSQVYLGLFYKIYHIKSIEDYGGGAAVVDYGYHVGGLFSNFEVIKNKALEKGPVE